jgi:hypothetical protein
MYTTTLTAFIAIVTILALIVTRPPVTARHARQELTCRVTTCVTHRASESEQFPRLSRNRWARQDISRMLMTDDDFTGRITPHTRPHRDHSD